MNKNKLLKRELDSRKYGYKSERFYNEASRGEEMICAREGMKEG